MVFPIVGFLLAALGAVAVALQRLYSVVPTREVKRLASEGDILAKTLYRSVAYGRSLRLLLWSITVLGLAGGSALLALALPSWLLFGLSVAAAALLIWSLSIRLTPRSARLAASASPILAWILQKVGGPLHKAASWLASHRKIEPHTGLFRKEDLHELLTRQSQQSDNRIPEADLGLTQRALSFRQRKAADIASPRSSLRLVNKDDSLGPILLGELHNSGQTNFLVYDGRRENVVGSLYLKDAVSAKEGGKVAGIMRRELCFVHEEFSLPHVLGAFRQTKQQLAVVVNSFEEFVGAISLEHLLHELIGDQEGDHLDYESRATIGAYTLQPAPVEEESTPAPTPPEEEPVIKPTTSLPE